MKTDPSPSASYARLEVDCPEDYVDILIAELAEAGFDMFMERPSGFEADAEESAIDLGEVERIKLKYKHVKPLTFRLTSVQKENWNELWEKNVTPVIVEDQCAIRASFHTLEKTYPYEIIITPKMSFGTGHHPTTYLMLKGQLELNQTDKRVMDAGCGTAILSIMASKRGATEVEAFDIDEWSIANGEENAKLNHCANIRIQQGTIADFAWAKPFDIILANINRNILLAEMAHYARWLSPGGILQLSGFYERDIPELVQEATRHGLTFLHQDVREQWATLQLKRVN